MLEKYKNFLENGEYVLSPNIAFLENFNFLYEHYNKFIKYIFFNKKYIINSSYKIFDGKLLYIGSNEVKIFSDEYVIGFKDKKEAYQKIKGIFRVPKIEFFNKYYKEELIIGKKVEIEEIMKDLIKIYKSKSINVKECNKKTFILTHGDIHQNNVIKRENELYYIDYDSFGEYIFYYDFINMLFAPAINGDFFYLKLFLKGKYDVYFRELFNLFNLRFNSLKRKDYLLDYLDNRINNFDKGIHKLKKYKEILKCVE